MANKKKSSSHQRGRKPAKPASRAQGSYILSIVLFALAVFTLLVAIIPGEAGWTWLHAFEHGLFGITAYVWPVLIGYIAVLEALDKESTYIRRRFALSGVFLLLVQMTVDVFRAHPADEGFLEHLTAAYTSGDVLSGGFFGALFAQPLWLAFKSGARIIICLLIFVFLMILTGTTLVGLFNNTIKRPADKIKDAATDAIEHVHRRQEAGVDISLDSNGNPYDVPIDGEPPRKQRRQPADLDSARKKLVSSYNDDGRGDSYNVPVDTETGEVTEPPAGGFAETESIIDDALMDKINEAVEVVADDSKAAEKADVNADEPFTVPVTESAAESEPYRYPPIDLLNVAKTDNPSDIKAELSGNAEKLVNTLKSFGVETRIIDISRGPSVTRYELQPAAGVKISRITSLADDIALNLASAGVRIEAPIPNKAAVGIEVPNRIRSTVSIRELIDSEQFRSAKGKLNCVLGRDISGDICMVDIAKMPHLLIAGTTGSGKSVCLNSLIVSMLYRADPSEVKMLMIDPKAVEMKMYNGIPHLLVPIVSDPRKAAGALGWAVTEMLQRYKLMADNGVKNLEAYNKLADTRDDLQRLPQVVIFIDELSDLMMAAPNEVEDSICRLAQMARAAGMHLIIATQRPSVNVITGLIKANVPSRIALTVSSQTDSRIILDMAGAEKLIGRGDMLFAPVGSAKPIRIQGCWVSDEEIEAIVDFLSGKSTQEYDQDVMDEIERQAAMEKGARPENADSDASGEYDDMLPKAIECVVEAGQASTSLLQRKLKLGYARAARIVDQLEERGIVGPYEGSKPRKVLMTKQQWLESQALGGDDSI